MCLGKALLFKKSESQERKIMGRHTFSDESMCGGELGMLGVVVVRLDDKIFKEK
jgi:hypothetical protein